VKTTPHTNNERAAATSKDFKTKPRVPLIEAAGNETRKDSYVTASDQVTSGNAAGCSVCGVVICDVVGVCVCVCGVWCGV
jgi:hypothetical protein